jgi:DNA-binding transcriptional regulator YhcF (GntR family)
MTRNGVRDRSEGYDEGIGRDASFRRTNGFAHVTEALGPLGMAVHRDSDLSKVKAFNANVPGGFQAAKEAWLKALIAHPNLSGADMAAAVAISTFLNRKTGEAWPSLETLADMTNRNRSTVWRAIKHLEELKLLEVRKGRGRHVTNRYRPRLGLNGRDPKTLQRRIQKVAQSQQKDCELAERTLDNP